ncbi:holo-ACP synthase [Mycetocola lacteus]|uniref:Holo-[acyl-carrier-protein] synthase n=1 Tax=Mycetocola lacteus TaxID=76637 RepID=A0A3L7ATS4_9MICO|nr:MULTISPECIES: holo-ACP synthase [Mycetocola]MCS4277593.1 holo-[acyl-carrier protein] synthase [Mycetocola sp. BIGb0189]RLP83836.1 holo-ACP synthase [Mycetocola lacteus]
MIVGIGVDLVDLPRFLRTLERTPALRERLFTPAERELNGRSLAGRFAAKEALIKALGGSEDVFWQEIEVLGDPSGAPILTTSGSTARRLAERGIESVHLSISHDGDAAIAFVVAEGGGPR